MKGGIILPCSVVVESMLTVRQTYTVAHYNFLLRNLLKLVFWNLTTQCLAVTGGGSVAKCVYGLTSFSTHNKSFWRQVFPDNRLHWYRQPNNNNTQNTK